MRNIVFITALLSGCSSQGSVTEKALGYTEKALGVVNGTLLEAGTIHEQGAQHVVEYCRSSRPDADRAGREACVAKFQYSVEQVARREQTARDLAALQDTMADVLAEMKRLLPQVEADIRAVRAAVKEAK